MLMVDFLTAYARALLRGGDKEKAGKDQWPAPARGNENVRRGETVRSGEAANFAAGGKLKSKPRGARPAKPGASSQR
jgi:hypothetical protein